MLYIQAAVFFYSNFRMGKWVLVCDQMGVFTSFMVISFG